MDILFIPTLPNEMIDRISKELSGIDLFHFTLANHTALSIGNYHLIQLLYLQPDLSLDKETKSLLHMRKSPYFISENNLLEPRLLNNEELMLFKIWGNNRTPPNIVTNLNQFIENLTSRYEYDLWGPYINWDTFVIAGGSVISSLLVEPLTEKNTSDIDLFFLQQNSRLFKTAVVSLTIALTLISEY
ncbi:unnamed protein product [Rotaria sordida]|uniref:F-box domain-containing protein n=1 Tax=Rotaria sordida TaxID=392033 RepID=A0A815CRE3_9BILA|nr:unnamed protein product [Rotaria sordida]CAF1564334.1 unnamed protein product [Rotaria sordida]